MQAAVVIVVVVLKTRAGGQDDAAEVSLPAGLNMLGAAL
jgi:hypothetical protein